MPNAPSTLPVLLVSGFLGAGKTTLMRRLILDGRARNLKICVVVNEFGAADVDGNILREANAELLASITGGCACCSGQDDFHETMLEIASRPLSEKPDVILVESSGLADPSLLLEVLTSPQLLSLVRVTGIVCVADAARPSEYSAQNFGLAALLKSQLQLADVIVLNKTDLAERNTLIALETHFRKLNPHAVLDFAVECEFDLGSLWGRVLGTVSVQKSKSEDQGAAHAAHTMFCPLPHPVERARLEAALAALPPEVWRAKGFVRLRGESGVLLVQYTGGENYGSGASAGRTRIAPFHLPFGGEEPNTGLVFIGAALDEKELLAAFFGRDKLLSVM